MPTSQTPTIYFGYGSNLWLHQMATRCPQSHYLGIARLDNYKWIINNRGYANIVEIPSSSSTSITTTPTATPPYSTSVYALVFSLSPTDESRLDANEGVPHAYTKSHLPCTFWPGTLTQRIDTSLPPAEIGKKMLVYIDRKRTTPDKPREEYIYRINRGVEDALRLGVPEGYVEEVVRGFVPQDGDGKGGRVEELAKTQAERFKDESGVF